MADAGAHVTGHVGERAKNIFFADADHAIVETEGVGLYETGRGNGFFKCWLGDLVRLRFVDALR